MASNIGARCYQKTGKQRDEARLIGSRRGALFDARRVRMRAGPTAGRLHRDWRSEPHYLFMRLLILCSKESYFDAIEKCAHIRLLAAIVYSAVGSVK